MIEISLKALGIIDDNNEVADWSSPMARYFNALHEAFSVDDGNGYIYINGKDSVYVYPEDDPDDGDDGDKIGCASVGSTRTVGYVKKLQKKLLKKAWKAAKTPEERAKLKRKITAVDVALRKVIDFDNLLEETQRKLNEYVMSRLSEVACAFFPTNIADLLYLDRQGVSVQAQVYFYSLLMDLDDPMGGADAIKGYKRRLFLNILETAVTAWLRRKGHKLRNSSCLDEWLHGRGFLGRGLKKRRSIKSDFVNHMRAGFRPAVLERIGKQKMTVDVVMMSWDVPPIIIGQPEMFRHGKVMVAEIEHGVGNYENAFTTPASNLPDPDEDGCYHVKNELRYDPKFTDEQCRVARERNIAKVRVCERTGVLTSIDKNDKAWLDNCGTTFVDYLTKTHVPDPTVFGEQPSSFKWAVAFNYKGIYMMELEYDGDDLIRVVVIFCPWCNMFFSKVGTKASAERLASMEFTADSAQFYHELMCYFCTENASLLPSTSKLSLSDGYRRAQMHHQRGLDSDVNFLVRVTGARHIPIPSHGATLTSGRLGTPQIQQVYGAKSPLLLAYTLAPMHLSAFYIPRGSRKTTWEPTSSSIPTATPCFGAEISGSEPPGTPQIQQVYGAKSPLLAYTLAPMHLSAFYIPRGSRKTTWEPTSSSIPTATPCFGAEISGSEPPGTPQIQQVYGVK
ncbi:hypothetical protein THAOC_14914 [Thalassiosira oceanica]|uniref:Uncharacterized protein n=1 Tax=Thalassiosira oceanica TaxID=159749 RepID=K0SG83_THAOC|nr:hypothetical protein THAOC_14914 [Thalassiosira oceanica]|eukprot:EJK64360.1 hypothetical protein THAOC_14914 [Thalassiosira oceanica]